MTTTTEYTEALKIVRELPSAAVVGPWAIGEKILVSREAISDLIRNPDLPTWFPARVALPPREEGNWYRWYDPFIWYETEIDLSNGGQWPTEDGRNRTYVGKLWYDGCKDFWAIPASKVAEVGLP